MINYLPPFINILAVPVLIPGEATKCSEDRWDYHHCAIAGALMGCLMTAKGKRRGSSCWQEMTGRWSSLRKRKTNRSWPKRGSLLHNSDSSRVVYFFYLISIPEMSFLFCVIYYRTFLTVFLMSSHHRYQTRIEINKKFSTT